MADQWLRYAQASLDEAIFPGVSEWRLGGRVVVVTGGAHGIGQTVAQALIGKRRRPAAAPSSPTTRRRSRSSCAT